MAFSTKSYRDRSAVESFSTMNSNRAILSKDTFRPSVITTHSNRSPDGHKKNTFKGLRAIRSSGPTACIRPANLVYRAPSSLHGDASRLLRQILRVSSAAEPPTSLPSPPSLSVIRSSTKLGHPIKPCFQGDHILDRFLLNNGGYLDDSDSESEGGDHDEVNVCRRDPHDQLGLAVISGHRPGRTMHALVGPHHYNNCNNLVRTDNRFEDSKP